MEGEVEAVDEVEKVPSDAPIVYQSYVDETQLPVIMEIIDQELSEPYSIFTYRYFITLWPHLCFMAFHEEKCVGVIVCKMGQHRSTFRGYIAMLVVTKPYRGRGIATELVTRCIQVMLESGCDEVTLEAEVTNKGALALYGNLGFIRDKRLHRYYLNGVDAFRLKLLFPRPQDEHLRRAVQVSQSGSSSSQIERCCDIEHHCDHEHLHQHYAQDLGEQGLLSGGHHVHADGSKCSGHHDHSHQTGPSGGQNLNLLHTLLTQSSQTGMSQSDKSA